MAASTTEQAVESVCAELGYTTIKDKQKEVILNFVSGRDVFAALPTVCCWPSLPVHKKDSILQLLEIVS